MTNSSDPAKTNDKIHCYELVAERVRIFQRGKKWYANFQHRGRQHRQSLGTTSKKEARRRALGLEAQLASGEYQRPKRAPSLAEVIDQYRSYLETKPASDFESTPRFSKRFISEMFRLTASFRMSSGMSSGSLAINLRRSNSTSVIA